MLKERWSSPWAFIFAAGGAAVGLGNIWRFPFMVGTNGGGAFVLVYLLCVIILGIPLLMAEIAIGRRGRLNPADSMRKIAQEQNRHQTWGLAGLMMIVAGFLIFTYYAVIAGWTIDYTYLSISGTLAKTTTATELANLFQNLINHPLKLILCQTIVVIATMFVLARGVKKGIEIVVRLMFPLMFIILLMLLIYAATTGYFSQAMNYLFAPDFGQLTTKSILVALGQAFFTLSLASGQIMMYGAYLPKNVSITRVSIIVVIADTLVAILAGMIIFPIVFAYGVEPSAGEGLLFQSLPLSFQHLPLGSLFATLFFIMVVCAAFTSCLSLVESSVSWTMRRFNYSRLKAAIIVGILAWLIGLGTVFSFNYWSKVKLFGYDFFSGIDNLTANLLLPLGALFTALFVAWTVKKETMREELNTTPTLFNLWYITIRYITPLAILIVFIDIIIR